MRINSQFFFREAENGHFFQAKLDFSLRFFKSALQFSGIFPAKLNPCPVNEARRSMHERICTEASRCHFSNYCIGNGSSWITFDGGNGIRAQSAFFWSDRSKRPFCSVTYSRIPAKSHGRYGRFSGWIFFGCVLCWRKNWYNGGEWFEMIICNTI